MAESLGGQIRYSCSLWDLGSVVRRDDSGALDSRVVAAGVVQHAVLQFISSPVRRELRIVS
jgi:hypothetical protein